MKRSNRTGSETRARILDAAIDVLATEGFAALTLRAVAARAGILYGNLTHHYGSRDLLIEAVFETLVARYRAAFEAMAKRAQDEASPVRIIVGWLLDDAVSSRTAPVFLQLWSMAAHMPSIAEGMARLYDSAVDAFIDAFGLDPAAPGSKELRTTLYFMGTVLEGSSAIFWTRDPSGKEFQEVRARAIDVLVSLIERDLGR